MPLITKITPCLWFDGKADDAARFYTAIFPRSKLLDVSYYGEAGQDLHGAKPGSVLTVEFELDGQRFTALNGGPLFKFTEAISFQVGCDSQDEIDHFWARLGDGGPVEAQQCGWLKDRFGVSWQVVPSILGRLLSDPDPAKRERAFGAMMKMKKFDLAELKRAHAG